MLEINTERNPSWFWHNRLFHFILKLKCCFLQFCLFNSDTAPPIPDPDSFLGSCYLLCSSKMWACCSSCGFVTPQHPQCPCVRDVLSNSKLRIFCPWKSAHIVAALWGPNSLLVPKQTDSPHCTQHTQTCTHGIITAFSSKRNDCDRQLGLKKNVNVIILTRLKHNVKYLWRKFQLLF